MGGRHFCSPVRNMYQQDFTDDKRLTQEVVKVI